MSTICPYICEEKNEQGYCKHTACVNNSLYKYASSSSSSTSNNAPPISKNTLCLGEHCERANTCKRYIGNATPGSIATVENFYTFGSGSMRDGEFIVNSWCGPLGKWKMYESVLPIGYIQMERTKSSNSGESI